MKRLGVIGTMVWDTIHGRDPAAGPVAEWGGIAYALAALEVALPPDWELVPLIKVGRDFAAPANDFLRSLTRRSGAARFVEVPEPNNQVTLHYQSAERRCELLRGGVPGWQWPELGPMVRDLDAIYVNFISGFELSLETAGFLRHGFAGPIYADLHSLFLGVAPGGMRVPRPLPDAEGWFECFDAVQLNEDEMTLLGSDPMAVAATALSRQVRLLVVTLGAEGAVYFTDSPSAFGTPRTHGPVKTARIPTAAVTDAHDPTGCGDVFGATLVAHLLAGDPLDHAIRNANDQARRNLAHRGATSLHYHLRGEIAPR